MTPTPTTTTTTTPGPETPTTSGPGPQNPGVQRIPTSAAVRVLLTQAVLALVVGITFLLCYAGLQTNPQPHHLPLVVVGENNATQVSRALGAAVAVTTVATDDAARSAVARHTTVAAMSQHGRTIDLLIAQPNGFAENLAAQGLVQGYAHAAHLSVDTVVLIPTVQADPRGLNSFYIALAVTVASFILAQAMYGVRHVIGPRGQLITMLAFAAGIAGIAAVIATPVLHLTPARTIPLAAVLTGLSMAVSLPTRALTAWCGPFGITIATLAMTAVGLSTSGGILGPNLLPPPLATLGAALPPGLALRAIIATAYFAGHGATAPITGLLIWAAAGLTLLLAHHTPTTRNEQPATTPSNNPTAAPVTSDVAG